MLSPRYLSGISDDIVRIYSQLEHDIVIDMARRLHKMKGVTDASIWQAGILKEIGGLQSDVQKYLAKYDKEAQKELIALFEEALSKSDKADMRVFDAAKRSMSDRQRLIFEAIAKKQQSAGIVTGSKAAQDGVIKTFSNLSRFTMSIASTSSSDFITQANAAFMQTVSGAFDYNSALKNAVKNLAQKGVHTVEYTDSGKRILRSIEGAVRSNILTGINQTASRRTLDNCQDLDCDLVEVSAHMGARPSHAAWQGKIYSLSGTSDKYPSFYAVCMPGEPDGIGGVNCRHSYYPYFEGMERMYNDGELDEMKEPTVEYNGKKMTQYEAEQNLRALERGIRKHKLEVDALEAASLDATAERQRLGAWQAKARDYCQETGIQRDYSREYVGTARNSQPKGIKHNKKDNVFISSYVTKAEKEAKRLYPNEKWIQKGNGIFVAESRENKTIKKDGKINTNELNKLKTELKSAKVLAQHGHTVYFAPEENTSKHFDAIINGSVETEIKTITGNRNTIGKEFKKSLKQSNNVFLDLFTDESVISIKSKLRGELMATEAKDGFIYCYFRKIKKLYLWKKEDLL